MEDWELVEASSKRREMASDATIRDYFAAKMMPAIIGTLNGAVTGEEYPGDFDMYAECAYKMADAMLRARGQ